MSTVITMVTAMTTPMTSAMVVVTIVILTMTSMSTPTHVLVWNKIFLQISLKELWRPEFYSLKNFLSKFSKVVIYICTNLHIYNLFLDFLLSRYSISFRFIKFIFFHMFENKIFIFNHTLFSHFSSVLNVLNSRIAIENDNYSNSG